MIELLLYGLAHVFEWQNILAMVIGVFAGMVIGALPGLSVPMGVALMLPFTFGMAPTAGILLLMGVYCGGIYGGSITAILLKTPGTAASAATASDGFALAQQGKAGTALNMSIYASVFGGIISGIILLLLAPPIADFALNFGPPEYFALAVFGLSIIAGISSKSVTKGLIMGCLGMLVSTVGIDPIDGVTRFEFGTSFLISGIDLVPALIGLFAISEIFNQIEKRAKKIAVNTTYEKQKFGWKDMVPYRKTVLKSSLIGTLVGAIPGTGASIAAFLSYKEAHRTSKDPDRFGKGSLDGIAAAESGNNGSTGGTLIPLMTLGIPGDVVTAVLLGALMIQGLRPGPELFTNYGDIVYTVLVGFILINVILFFQAKLAIRFFAKVTLIPATILLPVVLGLCLVGTFAVSNNLTSVGIALFFGVIGYFLPKYGFPVTPMLIAMILGPIAEESLRQSLILSEGSIGIFLTRPISIIFILLTIGSFIIPFISKMKKDIKTNKKEDETYPA
ncbi:tripartite tricarboxylate transporter permease [Bacillus sp. FJAT-27251]|uniref:tripartite tricarboxylate transporter permease n=1 Tax=Bacillus sp. FJAT-27251 TaxID=1684142 RepID=UPI0006A7BA73|nr:tripartite tricarboxylate transporter permease [Bacillus sp. FJAT-27251]